MNTLLMSSIFMFPFFVFGAYKFCLKIREIISVRRGYFKLIYHKDNGRTDKFFVKPEDGKFKIKTSGGDEELTLSETHGKICYHGSVPTIEYTPKGAQIDFHVAEAETPPISAKEFSNLMKLSYNLGRIDSTKENQFMFYAVLIACAASVITLLLLFSFIQKFPVGV